jgi:sialate O-acetylesterase
MKVNNCYKMSWLGMAAILCLCQSATAFAKVKLPTVFSDGVVVQRAQPVKVWGTADAHEKVELKFVSKQLPVTQKGKKLNTTYQATADESGRWSIELPALKPGGPYTMQVNDETVNDMLVGDLWLCSGQSNMELPVSRVTDRFADEIARDSNPLIHHIKVPNTVNFHGPQTDMPATATWKSLNPQDAMGFTAFGYFFAKAVHAQTGVPIGLINSSWGGTPVQSWISEDSLQQYPYYINEKRIFEDDAFREHLTRSEQEQAGRWAKALYRGDAGLHEATPWYAATYDDSAWDTVDMFDTAWGRNGLNAVGGSYWFRQTVNLPDADTTQDATLRLGCMVDADSVYVNGIFVGNITYQFPPRIYRVPASLLRKGDNQITVRLISYGQQPAFVPEKPYKVIYHAEGSDALREQSLSTQWKMHQGAPMPNGPSSTFYCYKPTVLYNAMIAPLEGLHFAGVLWYQGEANVDRRNEYAALMHTMIDNWRDLFGQPTLPFLIAELADYMPESNVWGRKAWEEMRQIQAALPDQVSDTYFIKNKDLGEWNDIHPLDKKTLGERAAAIVMEHILKK